MENLKTVFNTIKYSFAAVGSAAAYFLGGWDLMLKILVTLTVLDFLTGVLAAIYNKCLSSEIGSKGIVRKVGIYIIVAMAYLLDTLMNTNNVIRGATIGFYISIEGLSIVENWSRMELPLPKTVKDALARLKEDNIDEH